METLARVNSTKVMKMTGDTNKMTKKEMIERIAQLEQQLTVKEQEWNDLLSQTRRLQKEHGLRLAYLRVLQGFTNSVDGGLAQVKREMEARNATLTQENEEGKR